VAKDPKTEPTLVEGWAGGKAANAGVPNALLMDEGEDGEDRKEGKADTVGDGDPNVNVGAARGGEERKEKGKDEADGAGVRPVTAA
jgi:hypothetical protein